METTEKERLEIYKDMLDYLIRDREYSLAKYTQLCGYCWAISSATDGGVNIKDLPELMAIKR